MKLKKKAMVRNRNTQNNLTQSIDEDLALLEELLAEEIYESSELKFSNFFKNYWKTFESSSLVCNWYHECICEHLQAAIERKIRRLVICIPPRCLMKGTRIRMYDGTSKAIENLTIDDEVLSLDIKTGEHVSGKVTNVLNSGNQEVYRIGLQNGKEVFATKNHRFYTWEGYRRVKDLNIGDDISIARGYEPKLESANELTKEELRMLALWMAEGHKKISNYKITNFDLEIVEQAKKDSKLLNFEFKQQKGTFSFTGISNRFNSYSGKWIHSYFDEGLKICTTYNLYIPSIIFKQSKENIATFLGMWIATDGWITKNGKQIGITLASKKCVEDLSYLFSRLGITSQVTYKQVKLNDKLFDAWSLLITGKDNFSLCKYYLNNKIFHKQHLLENLKIEGNCSDKEEIPFQWVKNSKAKDIYNINRIIKEKRWSNLWNIKHTQSIEIPEVVKNKISKEEYWQKIVSIESIGVQSTYDISVDKYENFTLENGIHSHNSSKSSLGSIMLPPWAWLQRPEEKFWLISHSSRLWVQNLVAARRILEHPDYKERWCDNNLEEHFRFEITKDVNNKTRVENSVGGYIIGGSPTSGALGLGYSTAVLDDVLDSEEANSPAAIEFVNNWYTGTFLNRSNDVNTDVQIIVMQRLAQNDIVNYVTTVYGDQNWCVLNLPARFENARAFITSPIGFNDIRKVENELLDPIRLPNSFLTTQEKNPIIYNTRYQQNPFSETVGNFLESEWLRFSDRKPLVKSVTLIVWDLSFTDSPKSTFSVGGVFQSVPTATANGEQRDEVYMIDMWREQADIPRQLDGIRRLSSKYPNALVAIEAKGNGPAAMSMLERELPGIIPLNPALYGGKKEQRLGAVAHLIKAGKFIIYNPVEIDRNIEITYSSSVIKEELLGFPIAKNNDIVDVVAYALHFFAEYNQDGIGIITSGETIKIVDEDYMKNTDIDNMSRMGDFNVFQGNFNREDIGNLFQGINF